jgi:hypothetical protein
MAQVPYSGVPSVAPGGVPQSRYHADVNENTFGGNVGAALGSLGGQLQRSGNELFQRGVAMQDLYNHSVAQEADAQYTEKAGLLHANYNSLEGKNAVDAYPTYIEDLKKTRSEIAKGLPNPAAQKLFESSSNGTMGRSIFNGAGHAAGQNKAYAIGASTARVAAVGSQTLSFPEDDRSFKQGLVVTEQEVRAQGLLKGAAPEAIDEAVSTQKSKLWGERIKGMAKQDPMTATKWLEDGIKRGDVRGEDIGKLTNIVQQQRNTVGARMISNQVMKGVGTSYGSGIVPVEQAAEAIGTFESGGRYDLEGPEVFSKKTGASRGRALGKYQVMPENLPEWLGQAGMPPMTPKEFLKSPSAQDQLFNFKFGQLMKEHGSFNDAASVWFSGQPLAKAGNVTDATPTSKGTTVPAYVSNVNAILARNAPLAQKVGEGAKLASAAAPDDPLFPEFVEQRIKTDHDRTVAIKRDTEFQNRQVVEDALMGGKDGKLPTTVEDLTNTPEKAQAWQDLLASNQRRYLNVLSRNAKGDTNWTDTSLREYQRLKGQAMADPASFLDMDVVGTELPISAKRELINLQGKLKGKAEGDPRVARALNILAPDLVAAGIDKRNKDEFHQFTGALADQLQQWADENKKPPPAAEVQLIGRRLLQTQTQPGWLWNSKTPTFQVPVPSEEMEKIKQSGEWSKMAITPTPEQIQRIYTRALYQKLYGGTTKAQQGPGAPEAPSAPVSK